MPKAGSAALAVLLVGVMSAATLRWGYNGHEMAGRAAGTNLPDSFPAFFRGATESFAYLNPEPDRWRGDGSRELDEAFKYDHYLDWEALPESAIDAPDRWAYLDIIKAAGVKHPKDAGFLPFRIIEVQERLEVEFRLWRTARTPQEKTLIEQRVIQDAGILGHYVLDGSNPHHTTVHHDRWAEGYPNPQGFTTEKGFHSRFESQYVRTHLKVNDLLPRIVAQPRYIDDVRGELHRYLRTTHDQLNRLYQLDKSEKFGEATVSPAHKEFTVERLAAGTNMLRDLWWTAWLDSGKERVTK